MKNPFIIFFIIFSCVLLNAQNLKTGNTLYADENMILNVKQFSQFIKRFNYEEDFTGEKITEQFKIYFDRANYISFLFNDKDGRAGSEGSPTAYDSLINRFITYVVDGSLKIDRLSGSLFALATCKVNYNNVTRTLYLVLQMEKMNTGYRWALYDAYAAFIPVEDEVIRIIPAAKNPDELKFIPPTSNEVNFSHLRRVFEDQENLSLYVSQNGAGKGLNVLVHMVQIGKLDFLYVEKLSYYIFDIPGWVMEVKEFVRDAQHSGWLINNVAEWNKDSKLYMENLLSAQKNNERRF